MDAVVDRYFPVLDALESELEDIEKDIFVRNAARLNIVALYELKQKLMTLKHAVDPLRAATTADMNVEDLRLRNGICNVIAPGDRIHRGVRIVACVVSSIMRCSGGPVDRQSAAASDRLAVVALPTLRPGADRNVALSG